jgi:arginyl-tRNA synthetase
MKKAFVSQTLIQKIKKALKEAIVIHTDIAETYRIDVNKIDIDVDRAKNLQYGDYASSVVLSLGLAKDEILKIANTIAKNLPKKLFSNVVVAPPGFINMQINHAYNARVINEIIDLKENFGKFKSQRFFYNIEFVSANPTGMLHVGHARNAAIGDSLCRI